MNFQETGNLLATIQVYDNRKVDQATIGAWQKLLSEYNSADCLQALEQYYSQNREWIMPSDIINRVKEIQQARLNAFHTHPLQLREDDELDNERNILPGYSQKMRELYRQAKNGNITPQKYQAYHNGQLSLNQITQSTIQEITE